MRMVAFVTRAQRRYFSQYWVYEYGTPPSPRTLVQYNAAGTVSGRKPLSYRQYCRRYTNWLDSTKVTFHIQRIPGVNLELDFAGKTLCVTAQ